MHRKLTDTYLRGLEPPATGRVEIRDTACPGLSFRLTAKGAASWSFRYIDPETRRDARFTLGKYPKLKLGRARAQAHKLQARVVEGERPAAEKREAHINAANKTFEALAERYMQEHARRHKRSHAVDARNLKLHVLPAWHTRSYGSIKRPDAIELLECLVSGGKLTLVNRVQALLSKIFNFAIDKELLAVNPVFRLKRLGKETAGDRHLGDAEIRLFWRAVVEPPVSEPSGQALRLSLLTGARIGEVAGICRDELSDVADASAAMWVIRRERTKNGLPHVVPLAPMARAIIVDRLAKIDRHDRFLFPARVREDAAIKPGTLSNAMLRFGEELSGDDEAVRTWKADPPSAHDLRRTFATRMARLGIPKEIRDRLLNHAPDKRDTERRNYNQYDFVSEKQAALVAWDAALAAILAQRPADVVPIAAARGRVPRG
jgi:integrase